MYYVYREYMDSHYQGYLAPALKSDDLLVTHIQDRDAIRANEQGLDAVSVRYRKSAHLEAAIRPVHIFRSELMHEVAQKGPSNMEVQQMTAKLKELQSTTNSFVRRQEIIQYFADFRYFKNDNPA